MFIDEKLRLNDFQEVYIPSPTDLFQRMGYNTSSGHPDRVDPYGSYPAENPTENSLLDQLRQEQAKLLKEMREAVDNYRQNLKTADAVEDQT